MVAKHLPMIGDVDHYGIAARARVFQSFQDLSDVVIQEATKSEITLFGTLSGLFAQ